jgi:hypothetical protein
MTIFAKLKTVLNVWGPGCAQVYLVALRAGNYLPDDQFLAPLNEQLTPSI